jgi:hypothetical protein
MLAFHYVHSLRELPPVPEEKELDHRHLSSAMGTVVAPAQQSLQAITFVADAFGAVGIQNQFIEAPVPAGEIDGALQIH